MTLERTIPGGNAVMFLGDRRTRMACPRRLIVSRTGRPYRMSPVGRQNRQRYPPYLISPRLERNAILQLGVSGTFVPEDTVDQLKVGTEVRDMKLPTHLWMKNAEMAAMITLITAIGMSVL